ncbi:MAG: RHS repeat-associated core domain-containing protein [Paludibacteraceae bacterium]|nr:RHS repeat-associated core domain-containing protein [Paludibacteraceae bacterium]
MEKRYKQLNAKNNLLREDDYVDGKSFCCSKQIDGMYNDLSSDGESNPQKEQNIYFYHPDHLGSTNVVTDYDGRASRVISYIPYGEIFVEQQSGGWQSPYLFNAKELDSETGLYYYGARYLDPSEAMWLSVDPLFEKYVGMSPYGYCAGNPVRLVDSTGECTKVAQNEDRTYTVIGGDLNDKDRHIYVCSKDKDGFYTIKGSSIGISLTTTSFWDADHDDWAKGTIINPDDKSGINYIQKQRMEKIRMVFTMK